MKARAIYRFTSFALWVSIAFNVVVAAYVFFRLRRPVTMEIKTVTVEAPRFDTTVQPTNTVHGVSITNIPPQEVSMPREYNISYQVYILGERFARLGGYDYAVGDMCAYGRIRAIYPERIYLESGDYITNQKGVQNDYAGNNK